MVQGPVQVVALDQAVRLEQVARVLEVAQELVGIQGDRRGEGVVTGDEDVVEDGAEGAEVVDEGGDVVVEEGEDVVVDEVEGGGEGEAEVVGVAVSGYRTSFTS